MSTNLPVFPNHAFWTAPKIEAFCSKAVPVKFSCGTFILSPEAPPGALFLLETGSASMYHYSESGDVVTFSQAKPGDLIGTKGVFIQQERLFYTIADSDVCAWKINHESFLALLREDFEFVLWHFSRAFHRLDVLERKVLNSLLLSAYHRLVLTLLELIGRSPQKADQPIRISITQQELCNILSISRQTVGTCLKEMQSKGLLRTMRGQIEICDLNALRQEIL